MKKKNSKRGRKSKKLTRKEIYEFYLEERKKIRLSKEKTETRAPQLKEAQLLQELKRELPHKQQISRAKAKDVKRIIKKTIQKEYKFSVKQIENVLFNINSIIRETWLEVFCKGSTQGNYRNLQEDTNKVVEGSILYERYYNIMVLYKGARLSVSHYLLTYNDVNFQSAYYRAWVDNLKENEGMDGDEIYGT